VNLKRVRRLWRELGLQRPVRRRRPDKLGPKRGTSANSCVHRPARFKNDVWTYDLVADRTVCGQPLRWLTLVDEYTKECLALHVAGSVTGQDVRGVLARGPAGHRRRGALKAGRRTLAVQLIPAVRPANLLPGKGLVHHFNEAERNTMRPARRTGGAAARPAHRPRCGGAGCGPGYNASPGSRRGPQSPRARKPAPRHPPRARPMTSGIPQLFPEFLFRLPKSGNAIVPQPLQKD
jgi:hypothetical protein